MNLELNLGIEAKYIMEQPCYVLMILKIYQVATIQTMYSGRYDVYSLQILVLPLILYTVRLDSIASG